MPKVIPSTWELPSVIVSRFGTSAGKQRAMFHDGHLVLVTHLPPDHDEADRRPAIFWRNPSGAWKGTGDGKGGLSGLKSVLEAYRERVAKLDSDFENSKSASEYFRILQAIAPVLRAARHLHKTLQEARERVPADTDIIALRDAAADVERNAELVQSDAKAGLDFTVAKRAEEQAASAEHIAKSSHRLNLIAALFLPVSAIGSVFGVNMVSGLENVGKPWLFWSFIAGAFVIGFIVRASIDRKDAA